MTTELIQTHVIAVARGINIEEARQLLEAAEGEDVYFIYHNCSEAPVLIARTADLTQHYNHYNALGEYWECPKCDEPIHLDKQDGTNTIKELAIDKGKRVTPLVYRELIGKTTSSVQPTQPIATQPVANSDITFGPRTFRIKLNQVYALYSTRTEELFAASLQGVSIDRNQIIISFKAGPPTPGHDSDRVFNIIDKELMNGEWLVYEILNEPPNQLSPTTIPL